MKIITTLSEQEFLNYYLYLSSQSKKIQSDRQRSEKIVPFSFICVSAYFVYRSNIFLSVIFLCLAVVWYFFFPKFNKKYYLWHYKNYVNKSYKNQINKTFVIEFIENSILIKYDNYESKISFKTLDKIVELDTIIFLKLKDDNSIILSKNKINGLIQLRNFLENLAINLNIDYVYEEQWEWN